MTDLERNTRTLIVSFVIAVFALIPLRFVEVSNGMPNTASYATVLGESTIRETTLPKAEISNAAVEVQANEKTVNEVEAVKQNCLSADRADKMIDTLIKEYINSDNDNSNKILVKMEELEASKCR